MVRAVFPTHILANLQKCFQRFLIHVSTFEFIHIQSSLYAVSGMWLKVDIRPLKVFRRDFRS